jgi:quercetin dioxygenase-like cupin family protein
MLPVTRLYADEQGHARFEDVEISLTPDDPPPDTLSVSEPWQASAVLFGRGAAGGSHPDQPEHRRQLVIGVSGTVEVTATGETRTFGPGDVLLVEDTAGVGHSSRSSEGFVGAIVLLEPSQLAP